jgi:predicted RNA-binding protein YlqC (UPF0109 family)
LNRGKEKEIELNRGKGKEERVMSKKGKIIVSYKQCIIMLT